VDFQAQCGINEIPVRPIKVRIGLYPCCLMESLPSFAIKAKRCSIPLPVDISQEDLYSVHVIITAFLGTLRDLPLEFVSP